MKYLLSFAIGAILGDIFFHLIPESYQSHLVELNDSEEDAHKKVGLSVIAGIFMFIIVEMILDKWSNSTESAKLTSERSQRKLSTTNFIDCQIIDTAGYLSLIANGFDNFTHGLAIGASFLVGSKVGLLTTFVIFIHEIPHEICDYAILVNSGFSRLDAVKAQSSVSLFGILGTVTALYVKSVETLNSKTVWILPFSAGGFLYIALVNLLPEILDRKTNVRNTLGQVACVILGISFMAAVAVL